MALYDSGITVTGYYGLDALQLGHDPERYGNAHPSIVPYGMYEAADGPLIIAVGNNSQFDKFCRQVVMRPDIVEDQRFSTNVNRARNRLELLPMLKELIGSFPRDLLLERLTAAAFLRPRGRSARGPDQRAHAPQRAAARHAPSRGRHHARVRAALPSGRPASAHSPCAAHAGRGHAKCCSAC
jgi:crotonobetainyl-CoA:carnitine CoA-transferase CaiB-like acyl-CoA transferase